MIPKAGGKLVQASLTQVREPIPEASRLDPYAAPLPLAGRAVGLHLGQATVPGGADTGGTARGPTF
jgi:hypothetical protein